MTVSQNIGLPVCGYTHGAHFGDFMTSLAPADLHGKSLSNDTFFHFYTDALVLSSSITAHRPCSPPSTSTSRCTLPDAYVPSRLPHDRARIHIIVTMHVPTAYLPCLSTCLHPFGWTASAHPRAEAHLSDLHADEVHSILLTPPHSPDRVMVLQVLHCYFGARFSWLTWTHCNRAYINRGS